MAEFINIDLNQIREKLKKSGLQFHHIACTNGFIKRNTVFLNSYKGTFGQGMRMEYHRHGSTSPRTGKKTGHNLHYVEYWIKEGRNNERSNNI